MEAHPGKVVGKVPNFLVMLSTIESTSAMAEGESAIKHWVLLFWYVLRIVIGVV